VPEKVPVTFFYCIKKQSSGKIAVSGSGKFEYYRQKYGGGFLRVADCGEIVENFVIFTFLVPFEKLSGTAQGRL